MRAPHAAIFRARAPAAGALRSAYPPAGARHRCRCPIARRRPPQNLDDGNFGSAPQGAAWEHGARTRRGWRRDTQRTPSFYSLASLTSSARPRADARLAEGGRRAEARLIQHAARLSPRTGPAEGRRKGARRCGTPHAAAASPQMERRANEREDTSEKGALSRKSEMFNAYIF